MIFSLKFKLIYYLFNLLYLNCVFFILFHFYSIIGNERGAVANPYFLPIFAQELIRLSKQFPLWSTITKVASGLGMRHRCGLNKKTKNKAWFNRVCINAKKLVEIALRVYKQANFSNPTRLFYFEMKSHYKRILKLKKKAYEPSTIQTLSNVRTSKDIWSSVNRFRHKVCHSNVISTEVWHQYLLNM